MASLSEHTDSLRHPLLSPPAGATGSGHNKHAPRPISYDRRRHALLKQLPNTEWLSILVGMTVAILVAGLGWLMTTYLSFWVCTSLLLVLIIVTLVSRVRACPLVPDCCSVQILLEPCCLRNTFLKNAFVIAVAIGLLW